MAHADAAKQRTNWTLKDRFDNDGVYQTDIRWLKHPLGRDSWLATYDNRDVVATISCRTASITSNQEFRILSPPFQTFPVSERVFHSISGLKLFAI
ncbi:uncharacterized protein PHALS_09895 [Plasmopara halstedii]|uniref:Uncharacterized protein n=1 Tax=Plasmopara halstedii TaxID=4781 RepID=A0A0P1AFQ1_PLAHL|nr:uncharacterized protein PHALS_09895 [Plasmopara halstedii]CEG39657.1 hypothetical protein PHALS_09895 [Plasmopara halstedii]|eukprot:XP_024576026.1 hypothetical protein PHALS_09895 [Plasmopara halstedii]